MRYYDKITPDGTRDLLFSEALGHVQLHYTNIWNRYEADAKIPDGVQAIYLTYRGQGTAQLKSFELISKE